MKRLTCIGTMVGVLALAACGPYGSYFVPPGEIPKEGMRDRALADEMWRLVKDQKEWGGRQEGTDRGSASAAGTPLRLVIASPDWVINRNNLTGIIYERGLWASVLLKNQYGDCWRDDVYFFQRYDGQGYSPVLLVGGDGWGGLRTDGPESIPCSDIEGLPQPTAAGQEAQSPAAPATAASITTATAASSTPAVASPWKVGDRVEASIGRGWVECSVVDTRGEEAKVECANRQHRASWLPSKRLRAPASSSE
jgi:hypothetical protein